MPLKPISEIKVRLGINPDGETQAFLTNTCYKHMDKYVPRDSGALRENVSLTKKTITYKSPYAHFCILSQPRYIYRSIPHYRKYKLYIFS